MHDTNHRYTCARANTQPHGNASVCRKLDFRVIKNEYSGIKMNVTGIKTFLQQYLYFAHKQRTQNHSLQILEWLMIKSI